MRRSEFDQFVDDTFSKCSKVLKLKGEDYTPTQPDADRLYQFYQMASMRSVSPVEAVEMAGLVKHISRMFLLLDNVRRGRVEPLEEWDKNLIDVINYVILLRAVVKEENERR